MNNTSSKTTFKKVEIKKVVKKDLTQGCTAAGRRRFTTMLHPGLRKQLEISAQGKNISLADVMDIALREYFELTPQEINQLAKI